MALELPFKKITIFLYITKSLELNSCTKHHSLSNLTLITTNFSHLILPYHYNNVHIFI